MKKMILAGTIALAFSGPTEAASACGDATETYNSAIDQINYTLKRYANCVASSNGSDDCSLEFRRLKSAQFDFEMAVSSYQSDCV